MIQSASYLVCLGKRERKKRQRKKREKKKKKKSEKKRERKKCEEKKERRKKQNSDLSRLNLVVEFGLESVLCIV